MAYVDPNCKTKKELKARLSSGENIVVYQPGLGTVPMNGTIVLAGPHYPKAHTWYGVGTMVDGKLVKVK